MDFFFVGLRASDPDVIRFNLSAYTSIAEKKQESDVGPQVVHIYELGNRGPSDIVSAQVYIVWPTKTLQGTSLAPAESFSFLVRDEPCERRAF